MVTADEHILKKYHPLLISMTTIAMVGNMKLDVCDFRRPLIIMTSVICIAIYMVSIYFNCHQKREKISLLRLAGDIGMIAVWILTTAVLFDKTHSYSNEIILLSCFIYWNIAIAVEFSCSVWQLKPRWRAVNLIFLFLSLVALQFSLSMLPSKKALLLPLLIYPLFCITTGVVSTVCIGKTVKSSRSTENT